MPHEQKHKKARDSSSRICRDCNQACRLVNPALELMFKSTAHHAENGSAHEHTDLAPAASASLEKRKNLAAPEARPLAKRKGGADAVDDDEPGPSKRGLKEPVHRERMEPKTSAVVKSLTAQLAAQTERLAAAEKRNQEQQKRLDASAKREQDIQMELGRLRKRIVELEGAQKNGCNVVDHTHDTTQIGNSA
ncbi:hypothetical protein AAVH_14976 [Aphelenchoides avenae]|nr:hypothetical protein AAVH_14976 [Aphelenchus avenae]